MIVVIEWNNLMEICGLGKIMCFADGEIFGCENLLVLYVLGCASWVNWMGCAIWAVLEILGWNINYSQM